MNPHRIEVSRSTKYIHGLLKKISDLRLIVKHLRADRAKQNTKELTE